MVVDHALVGILRRDNVPIFAVVIERAHDVQVALEGEAAEVVKDTVLLDQDTG